MSTLPERLILGEAGEWEQASIYSAVNTMNVDHDRDEWIARGWEARTYEGVAWYGGGVERSKQEVLAWLKNKGYEDTGDGAHFQLREDAMIEIEVSAGVRTGDYNVFSMYSKETIGFTALGLWELYGWVEAHKEEIERYAKAQREELRGETR